MAIGSDLIFSDDFTRADSATSLGSDYTVGSVTDGVFGISSNAAYLASGGGSGDPTWAAIDPTLIGSANYRVKMSGNSTSEGHMYGAFVRLSVSGGLPTAYFLGKWGAGAVIRSYAAGVSTDLVGYQYVGAWDGGGEAAPYYLQIDVDTDGSNNVVLTISSSTTENGTYTQRATYTDSSASKILGAGTAALCVQHGSSTDRTYDTFRVIGTAAASGSSIAALARYYQRMRRG